MIGVPVSDTTNRIVLAERLEHGVLTTVIRNALLCYDGFTEVGAKRLLATPREA